MSEFYKPMRAYEYDYDKGEIIGRFKFIICGEMADRTKVWKKCDDDGEVTGESWYRIVKKFGKMVAIEEGV